MLPGEEALGHMQQDKVKRIRCRDKVLVDLVKVNIIATQSYYVIDILERTESIYDRIGAIGIRCIIGRCLFNAEFCLK